MKMSKPNNLSQRSKSARGRALHYLRFGLSALLLQSSFALAEASESSENSADEALIEPCDPFTDSTCSNRVELGNGQAFEGRLKQGKPHGRGMMFYPNGDRFEGHFDLGARTGRGTLFKADGSLYSGFWVRDRLNGAVEWRDRAGNTFQGSLVNEKPHGRGRMLFVNGDRYTGEFAMGLPHGDGVMVYGSSRVENVGDRYEGRFERGQRQGSARYIWNDGQVSNVRCQMDRCEQEGLMNKLRVGGKGETSGDQSMGPRRRLR